MSEQTPPPPTQPGTVSPDGQWVWNGTAWAPNPNAAPTTVVQKKGHTLRNLGCGCGALALLIIVIIIIVMSSAAKTLNNAVTSGGGVPAPAATKVVLDLTGSGTKTTQKFTVAGDWDLTWSYDCTAFGQQGNFQVFVYQGNGSPALLTPVNQLGKTGNGVENYHSGGQYYLTVNSECSWKIQAKG